MRVHPVVDAIRQAYKARGWTRRQLADRAGIHLHTVDAWEYKGVAPRLDQLTAVADALGLRLDLVPPAELPEGRPHVRVEPPMKFGRPHIRGISCDAIADVVLAEGVEAAMAEYTLRREDVLVACWFQGRYGRPRQRRLWRDWAEEAGGDMWHASTVDYARIPDPPDRPERPAPAENGATTE
jgi:transcriptional regulator with XRE-family HTH domain